MAESGASWRRSPAVLMMTIRRTELERLDCKLSALDPDARARVDEVTRLIVEKLLLTPTEQLKALGDEETVGAYAEALTRLFGLTDQPDRAPDEPSERGERGNVEPFTRRPRGSR